MTLLDELRTVPPGVAPVWAALCARAANEIERLTDLVRSAKRAEWDARNEIERLTKERDEAIAEDAMGWIRIADEARARAEAAERERDEAHARARKADAEIKEHIRLSKQDCATIESMFTSALESALEGLPSCARLDPTTDRRAKFNDLLERVQRLYEMVPHDVIEHWRDRALRAEADIKDMRSGRDELDKVSRVLKDTHEHFYLELRRALRGEKARFGVADIDRALSHIAGMVRLPPISSAHAELAERARKAEDRARNAEGAHKTACATIRRLRGDLNAVQAQIDAVQYVTVEQLRELLERLDGIDEFATAAVRVHAIHDWLRKVCG